MFVNRLHARHVAYFFASLPYGLLAAPVLVLAEPTESDFFDHTPVVLTATRLAQSPAEVPGAMTVIDRAAIDASGARTLADVLRLVPGYLVSGVNGATPVAAYHAPTDELGIRNLLLVDGRSLYANTFQGGTVRGMFSILLDDVERIEVFRGSNSAAYGAHAMFGVINVVTRHPDDVQGQSVTLRQGGAGVSDVHARLGWRSDRASHRLSVGSRVDDGYRFSYDTSRLDSVVWRGDLSIDAQTDLSLSAGTAQVHAGDGVPANPSDPERDVYWRTVYGQASWDRRLSPTEGLKLSASWTADQVDNRFERILPAPIGAVPVDASSRDRRAQAEAEYQVRASESVRWVVGASYKEDRSVSRPLFFTDEPVTMTDVSLFTHVEWRLAHRWLFNAGLFAGEHSTTGAYANPRLMVNYQLSPLQTIRFGWSTAQRTPSLVERFADIRFFNTNGVFIQQQFRPNPAVQPETLWSRELSYQAAFPAARLQFDARLYHEAFNDEIRARRVGAPDLRTFINTDGFTTQGMEFQLQWSPWDEGTIRWSHAVNRFQWDDGTMDARMPPRQYGHLGLSQRLPHQWTMSLWAAYRHAMAWRNPIGADTRVDLVVSRAFRWSDQPARVALTVQSLEGDRTEFANPRPPRTGTLVMPRRVFLTVDVAL